MDRTGTARNTILICLLLSLLTLSAYWPVSRHDFLNFDDQTYVAANPILQRGLTSETVAWTFTTFYASNWHPLTWLSHLLDVQLFGLRPGSHHLMSLGLHIANTLLLFTLLKRATGAVWRSAFVAALFALHPLHVESVAWAAERKDVLSTFFFFLSLLAYTAYAVRIRNSAPEVQAQGSVHQVHVPRFTFYAVAFYLLALLLFALGLMSKPMLVTLPFVMLLWDYWPLGRFRFSNFKSQGSIVTRLFVEKVPFFALSVASSVITCLAQHEGGSIASLNLVPFESRIWDAIMAYSTYLEKMVWPSKLAILYLRPNHWQSSQVALAFFVLLLITALVLWCAHKRAYFVVGWLWYLGTLVPVIGLVQAGNQFMADRYTYIPLIGCFIVIAWGGWELAQKFTAPKLAAGVPALLVISFCTIVTRQQLNYWQDGESIFKRCIDVTSNNYVAENNLAVALAKKHSYQEAKTHYSEALRLNPNYPDALTGMGMMLALDGDVEAAKQHIDAAAQLAPASTEAYGKLGLALAGQGKFRDAIVYYQEFLRSNPDHIEAANNLAWILATNPESNLRNSAEAVRLAEHACQLSGHQQPMLLGTLAASYAEASRFPDAIKTAEKARDLAQSLRMNDVAQRNAELLELYRAGKPYHESP